MVRVGRATVFTFLAIASLSPTVLPHGAEHGIDEALLENGQSLMVGRFTAPQPGPLVVVPYVDGPLGCSAPPGEEYLIPLGDDGGLMLRANATVLEVLFDVPGSTTGYAGFAVDTHDASRALILMQESAVALHALVGIVVRANDTGVVSEIRTGVLGVPYPVSTNGGHAGSHPTSSGRTPFMDHDGSFPRPPWCVTASGHLALTFNRTDLPSSLLPGSIAHAVALFDPKLPHFLPRPIEGSTRYAELNLYLARPGEDARELRAALDPSPGPAVIAPLTFLALGLLWVGRK